MGNGTDCCLCFCKLVVSLLFLGVTTAGGQRYGGRGAGTPTFFCVLSMTCGSFEVPVACIFDAVVVSGIIVGLSIHAVYCQATVKPRSGCLPCLLLRLLLV